MRTYNGRSNGSMRRLGVAALGSALIVAALAVPGGAPAAPGPVPTISGSPVVGQTLVANAPGDSQVYKWQRCNPATSNCSGGDKSDPNYVDIPDATGQAEQTYTLTAADLGFFVRVLVKDTSLGTQFTPSAPVGPVQAPPPGVSPELLPEHGVHLLGTTTEGSVKFKPPGQKKFSQVTGLTVIPVGSIINTRKGTILLVAATGEFGNRDPDNGMEYFDGLFKIKQSKAVDSPAIAKLMGKLNCGGGGKKSVAAASAGPEAVTAGRRKKRRRLWGSGSGSYGTAGRGGTGSVVGTTYLAKDTCRGTFFKVAEGTGIIVDAKGKKKDVFLGPGEDYFAER